MGLQGEQPLACWNNVAGGVRKVTAGIFDLWQPSAHSNVVTFDPLMSMSALPII